jgi:hypothetical protein
MGSGTFSSCFARALSAIAVEALSDVLRGRSQPAEHLRRIVLLGPSRRPNAHSALRLVY